MAADSFVRHLPCGSCGSSDANSLYEDGHTHCFACNGHTGSNGSPKAVTSDPNLVQNLSYVPLSNRGISEETCRKWSYAVTTINGKPAHVANYFTPDGNRIVAQKLRFPGKDFRLTGDIRSAGLFGQNLWRDGGKMLVITEGEIDAMSVSQVEGLKWPVVSIPNGAEGAAKALQRSLEWVEKFESVIFMFDGDEPGQKAAKECAELLSPGKARIASLPLKDANEMLKAGRGSEIISAKWGAKEYRPDGILAGSDLWDTITKPDDGQAVAYPWSALQTKTRGCRRGEIVTWAAGTGVGKSEVMRTIAHYFHKHGETIGYIALEESIKRTALGLMGMEAEKRLHIDRSGITEEELRRVFHATVGSGRFFLYDHWGSTNADNLLSKIRYMAKGLGCGTIILDHLSIVVSGIEEGDERRMIDNLMTRLRSLVEETKCRLLLVSHLRKADGTPHEEGGKVGLDDLRGSAGIKQLSDIIVGLERNQQSETRSNWMKIRVLKNRFTGETGIAGHLKYDTDRGVLEEGEPVFDTDEENNDF